MTHESQAYADRLMSAFGAGHISRRDVVRWAAILGVSLQLPAVA